MSETPQSQKDAKAKKKKTNALQAFIYKMTGAKNYTDPINASLKKSADDRKKSKEKKK